MKHAIIEKLNRELISQIKTEPQVVYILSRIRKILEIENIKDKFPVLNFYCNWSLHSEISKTDGKKINAILKEFVENKEKQYKLNLHLKFAEEFNTFLKSHFLPTLDGKQLNNFRFILGQVISDTPIKVIIGTRYQIIFKEPCNKKEGGLHIITTDE